MYTLGTNASMNAHLENSLHITGICSSDRSKTGMNIALGYECTTSHGYKCLPQANKILSLLFRDTLHLVILDHIHDSNAPDAYTTSRRH